MKDQSYSVDDILLEYELKKAMEPAAEASEPPPISRPDPKSDREASTPSPDTHTAAPIPFPHSSPLPRTADSVPRTAAERFGAHSTEPPLPPEKAPEKAPAVRNVQTRTRVLFVPSDDTTQESEAVTVYPPRTHEQPAHLDGQLLFEQPADEAMDDTQLEEQLRLRRREKVRDFHLVDGEKRGFKLTGEEEDTDAYEQPLDLQEEPEELEDFNEYAEAEAIRCELAYRRHAGVVGVIATAVMELLLLLSLLFYTVGLLTELSPPLLLAFDGALLFGMMAVNHRLVGRGLNRFFRFRADADSPAAVLSTVCLLYTVWQFFKADTFAQGSATLLAPVAGLALLLGALGRQTRTVRVCRNFSFVGAQNTAKYTAAFVEDDRTASELGRSLETDSVPEILYYKKCSLLTHFLEYSYGSDLGDRMMRWFVPICFFVSLLCAGGYALLTPESALTHAPTVFVSSLCLSMPIWTLWLIQRPLTRSCKRLLRRGAMLCGWISAEHFGSRTQALLLDTREIFPAEQVKLHGIKTFAGTRIDDAITDAAAVVIEADGPLSPIFHRLIENRTDILREVDSLTYEQDMGLSGWVGGKRVLVGNRRLLENHGVDIPPKDYEERLTKDGRCAVYLSTGGELSAMFIVSYLPEKTIADQLHAAQRQKLGLLVYTCDPNITTAKLCEVMALDPHNVQVLSAADGRTYKAMCKDSAQDPQNAEALLASNGRVLGKLAGAVQCRRLLRGGKAALVAQLCGGILAMLFSVFVSAATGTLLPPLAVLGWSCAYGLLAMILLRCFRV